MPKQHIIFGEVLLHVENYSRDVLAPLTDCLPGQLSNWSAPVRRCPNHFTAKERDPSTHWIVVRVGSTASLNVVLKRRSLAPLGDQSLMYNKQRNISSQYGTNLVSVRLQ
jgi:hypothetical protein